MEANAGSIGVKRSGRNKRRIESPPLPFTTRLTAGFAQPAGCGGAPYAVRNPASPPRGEAIDWLAALDYRRSLRTCCFTLSIGVQSKVVDEKSNPRAPDVCARQGQRGATAAHVPRDGLRPSLLLYFAAAATRRPWRNMPVPWDRRTTKALPEGAGGALCGGQHERRKAPRRPARAPMPIKAMALLRRPPLSFAPYPLTALELDGDAYTRYAVIYTVLSTRFNPCPC